MTPDELRSKVGEYRPFCVADQGNIIHSLVLEAKPRYAIEFGIQSGMGTAYIAAAMQELGGPDMSGVDAVDLEQSASYDPPAEQTLIEAELLQYVQIHRDPKCGTWTLMKFLQQQRKYGFAYIDGSHMWKTDGYAFMLIEKMLVPGGILILDDLDLTFMQHAIGKGPEEIARRKQRFTEEEYNTPQMRMVWELLAKTNPNLYDFNEVMPKRRAGNQFGMGKMGWCRKR